MYDSREKKKRKLLLCFFTIFLSAIYVFGLMFYQNRFLPRTVINGRSYFNKTPMFVKNEIENFSRSKKIKIISKNVVDEFNSEDIGYMEFCYDGSILDLKKKQNNFLWFLPIKREVELKTNIKYNKDLLNTAINYLDTVTGHEVVKSKNADVVIKNGNAQIVPEVVGTEVDRESLKKEIIRSIHLNRDIDLDEMNLYIKPKLTKNSKEILDKKRYLNNIKNKNLIVSVAGEKEIISGNQLMEWFSSKENIDKTLLKYIESLKYKYDNYGKGIKNYKTYSGRIVDIPDGGNYGWRINKVKTIEAFKNKLSNLDKKDNEIEPIYYNRTYNNAKHIGNTYIEVDLKNQMVYCFKDGNKILEFPAVTGLKGDETETHSGVYKIWSKEKERYLTGANYRSWVNIWMPFTYDGQGFHDASWQSSFGGDAYLYRGSKGCVNLAYPSAKSIYDSFNTNTPVILYK